MINKIYYADLHIHSHWSDGSCAPREIAKRAAERKITYICLTDVMNLGGWVELNKACEEYGLKTTPSLELQVFHENDWVELLLYGKNVFYKSLRPFLQQAKQSSDIVALLYTGYLKSQGIVVTKSEVDDFFKIPKERTSSLYRINEYLRRVRKISHEEIGRLIRNAHLRHIDRRDIYREWLPRLDDVLKTTNNLDIVSCYAYPGITAERRRKMKGTDKTHEFQKITEEILTLRGMGLNAVEVRHPEHSLEEEKILLEFAIKNDLIVIGGSGFHGDKETEHKPGIKLGSKGITNTEYEIYRQRAS
ncbi:MAG: PHP domain-containing protein [Patescibacteria group bacterium]